ncbi:hypothetical protein OQA88_3443 [Cercophora sp. LCS_1]
MMSRTFQILVGFVLLFLAGVNAQSSSVSDYCFDPASQETTTAKYSNGTTSATKTAKPTTLETFATSVDASATPSATGPPVGSGGSLFGPELALGLVAAVIAL